MGRLLCSNINQCHFSLGFRHRNVPLMQWHVAVHVLIHHRSHIPQNKDQSTLTSSTVFHWWFHSGIISQARCCAVVLVPADRRWTWFSFVLVQLLAVLLGRGSWEVSELKRIWVDSDLFAGWAYPELPSACKSSQELKTSAIAGDSCGKDSPQP